MLKKRAVVAPGAAVLSMETASASVIEHVLDGTHFGRSNSIRNLTVRAPFTGGALDGSLTADTSTGTAVLVDWDLAVTQPGRFTPLLRSAHYASANADPDTE